MRDLTLILTGNDPNRARAGIEIVGANAALGGHSRIHFDRAATALLNDATIRELLPEITAIGATLSVCPTGIAECGVDPATLPSGSDVFGMIGLMSSLGDTARLIML